MLTQNLNIRPQSTDNGYLTIQNQKFSETHEIENLTIIGRDESCQIGTSDPFASTRHARIIKRDNGFYIQDQRSRNGTYVNGSRVIEAKLQDHDRILIGQTEYIFHCEKNETSTNVLNSSLNQKWDDQLKKIPGIAQSAFPVLILGPSGTGKEVIANSIHRNSKRSKASFLSVNCSALTDSLAESELFGHLKGSFTGAQSDRKGAFEAARQGTLFLDEIGDMPLHIQPKLLRAIENSEIKPVGSDQTQTVDVRIVAATNKNLRELVAAGKFREDLYFRLHILQIHTPTLMERMEDFDALLKYFARPQKVYFTIEALAKLKAHVWPGNVRELKNTVARASALFGSKPITEDRVNEIIEAPTPASLKNLTPAQSYNARKHLRDYEREAILDRLVLFDGNQRQAAADLGMAKSTLHDRIRRYNIDVNEIKSTKFKSFQSESAGC